MIFINNLDEDINSNILKFADDSKIFQEVRCSTDCSQLQSDLGTAVFVFRVFNRWNQLDQRVVDASSINAFKGWLNKMRETRMGFFTDGSAEP